MTRDPNCGSKERVDRGKDDQRKDEQSARRAADSSTVLYDVSRRDAPERVPTRGESDGGRDRAEPGRERTVLHKTSDADPRGLREYNHRGENHDW